MTLFYHSVLNLTKVSILDFLFPKYCLGCRKTGEYFCPRCLTTIKAVRQICPVCERASPFGKTHPLCQTRYSLDGLISFFAYGGIIREAIHKLKYKSVTDLKNEFSALIFRQIETRKEELILFNRFLVQEKPTLIPIPLFWYKENVRGFNQAGLFANSLAEYWQLPFSEEILRRHKMTPSQTKLSPAERQKNVQDAFSLSPNYQSLITNYLLVDDVWTTGATLKTAGNLLKRAGVKNIWVLTVAR